MWGRLEGFLSRLRANGPLLTLCVVSIALGVVLRAQSLGFPNHLTFDEHHFVENARNYLRGAKDWNDHPPLGKLIIALPMYVLGDTSFAWRLAPLLFGCANIGLAFALGRRLFRDPLVGLLAATFFAIDGFLLSYSRAALLDGMLTTTLLGSVLFLCSGRHPVRFLAAGALIGCAMAIKVSGVVLYGPLAVATLVAFLRGTRAERAMACAAWLVPPLVYLAWFSFGLHLMGRPADLDATIAASNKLFEHHAVLTDGKNPLISRWYQWFRPQKPILLRQDDEEFEWVRVMTSLGNPLLWWASATCVIASIVWATRAWGRRLLERFLPRLRSSEQSGAEPTLEADMLIPSSWLLVAHASAMAPWVLTERDSYVYHYLPSYAFGLILLAGWAGWLYRQAESRRIVLAVLGVVVVVSGYYAPVWAQLPVSKQAFAARPLVK